MTKRVYDSRFWAGISPWFFVGAIVVLFPVFAILTYENINRQKENSFRLLKEKGAALIRSFEAGTRTGMAGMQWSRHRLQQLLTETAQQKDIVHIVVTNLDGLILAHDNPDRIGDRYATDLALERIADSNQFHSRILPSPQSPQIFEVFKKFTPTGRPHHMGMERGMRHAKPMAGHGPLGLESDQDQDYIIFVDLGMETFEAARRADMRHTIMMALFMLLAGIGGIMLLFLAHGYRSARSSLSRVKAFSDMLVDNIPIGLVALDQNGRILTLNHVAEDRFGVLTQDYIGQKARQCIPKEIVDSLSQLSEENPLLEQEIQCVLGDRGALPLEVTMAILHDETGEFIGTVILFKDLTEIKELRKKVARSRQLAAVGRLAGGVAHEIRNPLSSIKGFATYFKERTSKHPDQQEIADVMIREIGRLDRVIGQLLDFSKPLTMVKERINLQDFIADSLQRVAQIAEKKHISLHQENGSMELFVLMDQEKIGQVLLNLYLNAIEAMQSGGHLTVTVAGKPPLEGITIQITDTGNGIDEKDLAQIFDPYFTTKATGTGLGLAIAHNIVEAHDGSISVESQVDVGTKVTIRLPLITGA
jgi:two-component system sensor histidine kinase HydH